MASFVDENGNLVKVKLGDAISTGALGYDYDNLAVPPPAPLVAVSEAPLLPAASAANRLILAAMRSTEFKIGSGGGSVILAPEAGVTSNAVRPDNPTTLLLQGIKLVRRPPAPLSVFINLPKGTTPELNGPYYVGTLNLFNFDLGTGTFMAHTEDSSDHNMAMPGAEARFDVTEVLQRQIAKGLWDGRAVTVTITTIGADQPGEIIYVTIESASLIP